MDGGWSRHLEALLVVDDETVDGTNRPYYQRLDFPEKLVHGLSPVPHRHVPLEVFQIPLNWIKHRAMRTVHVSQHSEQHTALYRAGTVEHS